MNKQPSWPRELNEWRFGIRELNHAYQLKTIFCGTFNTVQHFSCQMHKVSWLPLYTKPI